MNVNEIFAVFSIKFLKIETAAQTIIAMYFNCQFFQSRIALIKGYELLRFSSFDV